jgi:signal transduction histidine kinase
VWAGDDDSIDDEARLSRLRAHLEAAQRIAGLGSWEAELPSGAIRWSPNLDPILGWPDDGLEDFERLLAVVHPDDRRRLARVHATAVREGTPYAVDHRIVRGGEVRHLHQEVVVERDGDGPGRLIGTVQDVTEGTQVARRLLETESRRRELLHRLVRASDDARAQLAADLHDGPVQILTATGMRLEVLARTAPDPPPWLPEALRVVRDVSGQLRDILFELHPQVADDGVRDAVTHLASTVLPGTPVTVDVHGDEPSPSGARAVHTVVQEALWDVREHDSAEELAVHVSVGDGIAISIDGGHGAGPLLTRTGLFGVRERCEGLGGTAELEHEGRVLRCSIAATDEGRR